MPYIYGINPSSGPSGTGYVEVYGEYLLPVMNVTMTGTTFRYAAYQTAEQVNVYYEGATVGQHTIRIETDCGISNSVTFTTTSGAPTPVISSISPSTWQAGTTTPVSIAGTGFGTDPIVSIEGIGITWSITSGWDTGINMNVTVASSAPTQYDLPVTVTSQGYWGSGFQGQQGQSPTSQPKTANVQAGTPCAHPTRFHQTLGRNNGNGQIYFEYAWSSTSGNNAHLEACGVGEWVTYPGTDDLYQPQSPPFPGGIGIVNPTVQLSALGSEGQMSDTHSAPPGSFVTPFPSGTTSFTANQHYIFVCPCVNNGDPVLLYPLNGSLNIVRSVNATGPASGTYSTSKSGVTSQRSVP